MRRILIAILAVTVVLGAAARLDALTVITVDPDTDSTIGGTSVTITGEGFSFYGSREVTINNTGSELTDYPVLVTFDSATLVSAGRMKADGGDIRFWADDGVTPLSYWLVSYTMNTLTTDVWVKMPTLEAALTTNIYLTYGNATLESLSDGSAVFEFFDDFDADPGYANVGPGNGSYGVADSVVTVTETLDGTGLGFGISIEASFSVAGDGSQMVMARFEPSVLKELHGISFFNLDGANFYYLAGTQSWGLTPEQAYSGTGLQVVYAVLNDFSGTGYIALTEDDDSSNSAESKYDWVLVRKYTATEPTASVSDTSVGVLVKFGGAAADNVDVSSTESLTCVTPAHAAGSVDVEVINPDGQTATLESGYTYSESILGIRLYTPDGGELWEAATSHNITWETTATPESINIHYSTNEGVSYTTIATGEADDGTYSWLVSNEASTQALVRIEAVKGAQIVTDESDAVFTVLEQANFYVDAANGDNGSGDGTSGNPWKSLTYAVGQVSSGDIINAAAGTYNAATGESFPITVPSGVRIVSSSTGLATIDAASASANVVVLSASSTVEGFTIKSSNASTSYYAVYTAGNCDVLNNTIPTSSNGIWLYGSYCSAVGNTIDMDLASSYAIRWGHATDGDVYHSFTITDNVITHEGASARGIGQSTTTIGQGWTVALDFSRNHITMKGSSSIAIYLSHPSTGSVCESNTIILTDTAATASGITSRIDYACGPITIAYNTIEAQGSSTDHDAGIYYCGGSSSTHIDIASNEISGRFRLGIRTRSEWESYTADVTDNTVVGYDQASGNAYGVYIDVKSGGVTTTIRNNILTNQPIEGQSPDSSTYGIYRASGTATSDYNDVYNNSTNYTNVSVGTHDISDAPGFASPNSNDYRLIGTSPCVNAGTPEGNHMGWHGIASNVTALSSPNGGEYITYGTTYEITWYATMEGSGVDHLDLFYSLNNGASWIALATNEANDGTYDWVPPAVATDEALVRIEAFGDIILTAESDGVFTLEHGPYYYVNPVWGDNANDGRGPGTGEAWKTLSYGAGAARSGSTLIAAAGSYTTGAGETFPINVAANRTVLGAGTAASTIENDANSVDLVRLAAGASFEGFTLKSHAQSIDLIEVQGSNVTIQSSQFLANDAYSYGIRCDYTGLLVKDNLIWGQNTTNSYAGILLTANADNFTVYHNLIR
ncbi:DUF2341 domain-containing protein, partial [Candidatus Margulisiibacteriota bacterium]